MLFKTSDPFESISSRRNGVFLMLPCIAHRE
jgi:hypothetical protein